MKEKCICGRKVTNQYLAEKGMIDTGGRYWHHKCYKIWEKGWSDGFNYKKSVSQSVTNTLNQIKTI